MYRNVSNGRAMSPSGLNHDFSLRGGEEVAAPPNRVTSLGKRARSPGDDGDTRRVIPFVSQVNGPPEYRIPLPFRPYCAPPETPMIRGGIDTNAASTMSDPHNQSNDDEFFNVSIHSQHWIALTMPNYVF